MDFKKVTRLDTSDNFPSVPIEIMIPSTQFVLTWPNSQTDRDPKTPHLTHGNHRTQRVLLLLGQDQQDRAMARIARLVGEPSIANLAKQALQTTRTD